MEQQSNNVLREQILDIMHKGFYQEDFVADKLLELVEDVAKEFADWWENNFTIPNPTDKYPDRYDRASVVGIEKSFTHFIQHIYKKQ